MNIMGKGVRDIEILEIWLYNQKNLKS